MSDQDYRQRQFLSVHNQSAYNQIETQFSNVSNPFIFSNAVELDPLSVKSLPRTNIEVEKTTEVQHLQRFTSGPGSLNLCLSALLGLGLFSSTHLVKKLSFGFIPEWYHNGGPAQIGHSYALAPDSLCPAPIFCFIQPICTAEDSLIQHRQRTVMSIWRKSQFTPDVLTSRGPPSNSLLC
jgi:hypothetical protein